MPIATATARERQRARDITRGAIRDALPSGDAPDVEPPVNPTRLGPVHATEAYQAARVKREAARARLQREAAARAAAAERVTPIHHEPDRELRAGQAPTLVGLDGRPMDAESLVGPDGRPLQTHDADRHDADRHDADSELFDALPFDALDEFEQREDDVPPLDETAERRDGYGRHLELAHIIREFGEEYLAKARRDGMPFERLHRQQRVLRDLMGCRTSVMGEHEYSCEACGEQYVYFNSCVMWSSL